MINILQKQQIIVLLLGLGLIGCGDHQADNHSTNPTTNSQSLENIGCANEKKNSILVKDGWIRPAPAGRNVTALYLNVCNTSALEDILQGAQTNSAKATELHQTTRSADGRTSMAPIAALSIQANQQTTLEPGGYHFMLIGLEQPLEIGDTIDLVLSFKNTGKMSIRVPVKATQNTVENKHGNSGHSHH